MNNWRIGWLFTDVFTGDFNYLKGRLRDVFISGSALNDKFCRLTVNHYNNDLQSAVIWLTFVD